VRSLLAAILLAASLGACAKCDVPTYGWAGWFAPSACTGDAPRR
jgi:hypothetical protein